MNNSHLLDPPKFELESYIANYTGTLRLRSLVLLAVANPASFS